MSIKLSDSIRVGQQKPLEDKYFNELVPYTSTTQVNNLVPKAVRHIGLTVNIDGEEYWYKDGIEDYDLVFKSSQKTIEVTKPELDVLISENKLEPNRLYKITGVESWCFSQHLIKAIYLKAITNNTLESEGVGEFYTPKYNNSDSNLGIWKGELLANGMISSATYNIGDKVIWGNLFWKNISGNIGTNEKVYYDEENDEYLYPKLQNYLSETDWKLITPNDDESLYNIQFCLIKYDLINDYIYYREDDLDNKYELSYSNLLINFTNLDLIDIDSQFIYYVNSISLFLWGIDIVSYNNIYESVVLNCNNNHVFQNNIIESSCIYTSTLSNVNFINNKLYNSYFKSNNLSNVNFTQNILNNSSVQSNNFLNVGFSRNKLDNSIINDNELKTFGGIYNNILDDSQILGNRYYIQISNNKLINDSQINNNNDNNIIISAKYSIIKGNSLDNNSTISNNIFVEEGKGISGYSKGINDNILNNTCNINSNIVKNGSRIFGHTLEYYSTINGNTLDTDSNIYNNQLIQNGKIDNNILTGHGRIYGNQLDRTSEITNCKLRIYPTTSYASGIHTNKLFTGKIQNVDFGNIVNPEGTNPNNSAFGGNTLNNCIIENNSIIKDLTFPNHGGVGIQFVKMNGFSEFKNITINNSITSVEFINTVFNENSDYSKLIEGLGYNGQGFTKFYIDGVLLQDRFDEKQDVLTEDNVGSFMDLELATKSTPTYGDTVLAMDSVTGKAVKIPTDQLVGNVGAVDLATKLDKGGYTGTAQNLKNDIDNIQIGGRNYYPDGDFIRGTNGCVGVNNAQNYGFLNTDFDGNQLPFSGKVFSIFAETAGDTYALFSSIAKLDVGIHSVSFYYKSVGSIYGNSSYLYINGIPTALNFSIQTDAQWHKVELPLNITNKCDVGFRIGFLNTAPAWINVSKIQIEKGNKSTDWTPAPEDKQDNLQTIVGNVGIGTTSPSEKLEVVGYAKATGFKTANGTATQALTADGNTFDLNTKADLVSGKIPDSQLPSYVDDVLEFANLASFPATGESGKIYIAIDTNLTYRWGGSNYVVMSSSLALGETSSTAYRGDRGKIAYDHSQVIGNPHNTAKSDIGLGNVDNTSDLNKPISTATQQALNNKLDKDGNAATATALQTARTLTIGNTGKSFDGSGNVSWSLAEIGAQSILTNPITGTGTTNLLPKFTSSGILGNSLIYDNGTNVGIGTTTLGARLDIRAQGALATDIAFRVRNSADTQNFLVVTGAGEVYNRGAKGNEFNTFFGEYSGINSTGGGNNAFGRSALASNTTGSSNSAFGNNVLQDNTTGYCNNAFGVQSLINNITGNSNNAFGYNALESNTDGNNNIAIGGVALGSNTTGNDNTAVGSNALQNNTTGNQNVGLGYGALLLNTTGNQNIAIGFEAGRRLNDGDNSYNTISSNSIYLGYDTRAKANNETNQIVIGHSARGDGSNSVVLGNSSITRTRLQGQVIMGSFTTQPSGIEGAIYYNSTDKKHYGFNGTSWNALY